MLNENMTCTKKSYECWSVIADRTALSWLPQITDENKMMEYQQRAKNFETSTDGQTETHVHTQLHEEGNMIQLPQFI